MSSLLNPDSQHEPLQEHAMSQHAAPAASDITASLIKFWDTVRSSAELIVTLRQEVVQLRAQNTRLESELKLANEQASAASASNEMVDVLDAQIRELTEQAEQRNREYESVLADRDQESANVNSVLQATEERATALLEELLGAQSTIQQLESRLAETAGTAEESRKHLEEELSRQNDELQRLRSTAEDLDRLHADLSQARMELCEYELQVSAREAELRGVKDELALLQVQYEDLVERQSKATLADLAALNEVHEKKLSEAQLEAAEVRQTMERMKTEKSQLNDDYLMLAEKYQAIEVEVTSLQRALLDAQDALQQAHAEPAPVESYVHVQASSLELEALQHRLSELELIASKAADAEERMAVLQDEIELLQQQLEKAMGIVELYRAAGLRHIEDPDLRNQMSLFGMPIASEDSRQIIHEQGSGKGLSPEEMEALADRLDNLASRVAHLLGIS
jgi:chromosome segregation ATPase